MHISRVLHELLNLKAPVAAPAKSGEDQSSPRRQVVRLSISSIYQNSSLRSIEMTDEGVERLEGRLVAWLDQEGLTHRRVETPGTRFALEVRNQVGLVYNVAQASLPSDAVVVSGSILLPDAFRRLLERSAKSDKAEFLGTLRFDLLLAGHTFQFLPQGETPRQVLVVAQLWEDALTKDSFMRVLQHVVNGLVLVVWSIEEGAGYLSPARRRRRASKKPQS